MNDRKTDVHHHEKPGPQGLRIRVESHRTKVRGRPTGETAPKSLRRTGIIPREWTELKPILHTEAAEGMIRIKRANLRIILSGVFPMLCMGRREPLPPVPFTNTIPGCLYAALSASVLHRYCVLRARLTTLPLLRFLPNRMPRQQRLVSTDSRGVIASRSAGTLGLFQSDTLRPAVFLVAQPPRLVIISLTRVND